MTRINFVVLYLLALLPTYILPYFGSNSLLAQSAYASASGTGFGLVFTLLHIGALIGLVYVAHARGRAIGKGAMVALAVIAAVFDMVPILSAIPLVPTVLHVITLVLGSMDKQDVPTPA